jgi:type VI protein secretion system component Hcp
MKIQRLIIIAVTCLTVLLITHHAMAQVYPVIGYAQVTGQQQGNFTGSTRTQGYEGQITVLQLNVAVPTTEITKYVDASDAQFKKALANNESLTIVIQLVKTKPGQFVPQAYKTYTLKNVHVEAILPVGALQAINFTGSDVTIDNK